MKKSLNVELFGYSRSGEEESLGFQETRFGSLNLSEANESVWELKPVQHQTSIRRRAQELSLIMFRMIAQPLQQDLCHQPYTDKLSNDNEKKSEVVDNIASSTLRRENQRGGALRYWLRHFGQFRFRCEHY